MAKGKYCPYCNTPMFAEKETYKPAGTDVVYVCRNCGHKERVFEDN